MADGTNIIGEVTEASTTEFTAESRELHSPPPFGSFVKVSWNGGDLPTEQVSPTPQTTPDQEEDPFDTFRQSAGSFSAGYRSMVEGEEAATTPLLPAAIYAIVHQASTSAVDTSRRIRAYWKDEQQLTEEQPELSEWLLVTDFHAIIIGYSMNGHIRQFLPPQPPKIHSFVHPCTAGEVELITSKMDFLRTLSNSRSAPSEEVVAACIREAHHARGGDFEFLVAAGKELANLLKDDYDRLQAIMRRVSP